MDGQRNFRAELLNCLGALVGEHVDLRPASVVLPVLQNGEVDFSEPLPNLLKDAAVARIARIVDAMRAVGHVNAGPERAVRLARMAARPMLGGRERERNACQFDAFVPEERVDLLFVDAPCAQNDVDAQRNDVRAHLGVDSFNSAQVEVVVMVVRNERDVDFRNVFYGEREFGEPLWPGELERGRAVGKHGIEKDIRRAELQ